MPDNDFNDFNKQFIAQEKGDKQSKKQTESKASAVPAKPVAATKSSPQASAKKKKAEKSSPHVVRLILGVLVGYLVPCIALLVGVLALAIDQGVLSTLRWLDIIFIVLILIVAVLVPFYLYGWLHRCMIVYLEHHSKLVRVIGCILGGIGYVLHPFVLYAYGPNKKWLYFLLVGVPSLLLGGVFLLNYFNVLPFDGSWNLGAVKISWHANSLYIAIAFFLNGLLALCTRRCPRCGCMMTEIEHSIDAVTDQAYDKIDGVDLHGDNVAIGKYYVCQNCDAVKKGIGFDVQTTIYK